MKTVSYEIEEGIAVVTLDAPEASVNLLDEEMLQQLAETADRLEAETGVTGAVVISAKDKGFIAGADVRRIADLTDPEEGAALARRGQEIFQRWAGLPFPVVAAVHGHCLGGGTEFILACGFRVATAGAQIGLPEIKLGILPGFGGTQRLPRLIAVETALDLIVKGKIVSGEKAEGIGLVDRLATAGGLLHEAREMVREAGLDARHLETARQRKKSGLRRLLLEKNPLGRALLFRQAEKRTREKTGGHYPAPPKALEVIRLGLREDLESALRREAQALGELIVTPVCKNLVHIFFLSQRPKQGGETDIEPAPVKRAAVLGAGVMGGGIARLLAAKDIPVLLKDLRQEAVEQGREEARKLFRQRAARKGRPSETVEQKMQLITGTTEYQGFAEVDLVIEAVVEKMAVKQQVLQEAENHLPETAVFATNTSALSVTELQAAARRPGNVGGMHFFNPVHKMPLVEIVHGDQTSARTRATLFAAAVRLGKTPIHVADRPGFLVNRLLMAYINEACLLAETGVDWHALDSRARSFGLPMGPFRLLDEVGIDIAAEVGKTLCRAFPYLQETALLDRAVAKGLAGKKGGAGFYLYREGKRPSPNPQIDTALQLKRQREPAEGDWRRLLLLMVNEAGRCLEEGVVEEPEDIDTGLVFGTGFPPFRGGLCRWADRQGLRGLNEELRSLAERQGERFTPCSWLAERDRFYS